MFGNRIKIRKELLEEAKKFAAGAGYSSVDEFIEHCIEKELNQNINGEDQEKIKDRLKGLGYIS